MSGNHADRAHSVWSASSSAANFACPGRLRMIADLPPQPESEAAAWGTAAHEVAEHCLRNGTDAVEMIGRFVTTKEHRIEVDEEVAETAQVYVDYVKAQWSGGSDAMDVPKLLIEQRFSLERLNPPFEAGGTADAVIIHEPASHLEVVDLKGGRGVVVEAKGNPQLRTYALGALLTFRGYDVQHVQVTIVQPRVGHRDGIIRSETFHVADLMEWAADLLAAMGRAKVAWDAMDRVEVGQVPQELFNLYLKPGPHCRWCPANGLCPALARKAEEEARLWFTDESGEQKRNTPDRLTPEEVARILDHADMIQDHLNAVRAYAQSQAEGGVRIPGYILVEKHGREAWLPDVEAKVRAACEFAELPAAKIQNEPRLKTPKQIRKALGPAYAKLVETLSATPTAGHSLVRQDKTTRPEVPSRVESFFEVLD